MFARLWLFLMTHGKKCIICVFWVIAFLMLIIGVSHAKDNQIVNIVQIEFTKDEIAWINAHKTVKIGVDQGFAPFEFFSGKGVYTGLAADYVSLMECSLGIRFEPVLGISWEEAVSRAKKGEIDVLPCVGITRERKTFLTYSTAYLEYPRVIVVQTDSDIFELKDLKNKRIGVQARSSHLGFLKEETDFRPIVFDTFQEALQALSRGEIDAVIGNMAVVTYNMWKYNLTNLKIAAHATKTLYPLAFGIRKDWPILAELMNKVLEALPEEKRIEIAQKWMPDQSRPIFPDAAGLISLSEEEQLFLEEHSEIRVGVDPSYPPFEWLDAAGVHQGIIADYLKLIENRLGMSVNVIHLPTWSHVLESVKKRSIDVVACVSITPSRTQYLKFTKPYLSFPVVIITQTRMHFISGLRDLSGQKVSIVKDYAPHETISRDFPEIIISPCDSALEGLKAVSMGGSDAYIGNMAVCIYLMQNHNIANLKVAAPAEGIASSDLSMGVRSDWPVLVGILDKVLQSVTQEERSSIVKKWVSVRFEHAVDWGRVIRIVAIFLSVACAILAFILYWNRKLAKEVNFRRQIEKELEASKNKAEKALEELKTAQHHLIQSEKMAALGVLVAGVVHEINNPVNFIKTSIIALEQDIKDVKELLQMFERFEMICKDKKYIDEMNDLKSQIDYPVLVKEVPELVGNIFEGVRRTQEIIDSLRIYSRMDEAIADKKDIHELLHAALQILKSRYKKEIELKKVYSKVPMVILNSGKIIQVFVNVLSNAIDAVMAKAHKIKGVISLKTDVRLVNDKRYVVVEIMDNGTGISKDIKDKVFDPFFTTKEVGQGTGLGLSISIGIIREHNGMMKIDSNANDGTTVSIFLPSDGEEVKNNGQS